MKKQNTITSIIALALLVFAALACGNSGKKESTSTTGSRSTTTKDRSTDSGSTAESDATDADSTTGSDSTVSRGGSGDLSTPTKSHAAMYQAMKTGSIGAYKKTMSQCYLDKAAEFAKRQNISTDEFIKNSLDLVAGANVKTPEVRNEKISGDTATLEEKDFTDGSRWNVVTYVKEDGDWKNDALCEALK